MKQQSTDAERRASLPNTLNGALVFTLAGSAWVLFGIYSLKGRGQPWLALTLSAAALGLLWTVLSLRPGVRQLAAPDPALETRNHRAARQFMIVNAVQGVAIFLAVQLWNNLHVPEYLAPTIALIVGLHFIALSPVYRTRSHWIVGAIMCLLALFTEFGVPPYAATSKGIAADPEFLWGYLLGFGNGLILWISAALRLWIVRTELRPAQSAPALRA